MQLDNKSVVGFRNWVWDSYERYQRPMPFRNIDDPYKVFLSEIMLQQTQVPTVLKKYDELLTVFPTLSDLAKASFADVLPVWKGLGYNRRARWLVQCARMIMNDFGGKVPDDPVQLIKLPGIGPGTAGSIAVFAYNKPVVFIETNIRRILLYHFFPGQDNVPDSELYPIAEQVLDKINPREWYYALMDYGTYLSKVVPNPNRKSRHYVKQSAFEGSSRQIRSEMLHVLSQHPKGLYLRELRSQLKGNLDFFDQAMAELTNESFVELIKDKVKLL